MIEILSLGKIVIASRTGGNKLYEKLGVEGVLLYDSIDEAVELLSKVKSMSSEEKIRLSRANIDFYNKCLSNISMYDSYISLVKSLL